MVNTKIAVIIVIAVILLIFVVIILPALMWAPALPGAPYGENERFYWQRGFPLSIDTYNVTPDGATLLILNQDSGKASDVIINKISVAGVEYDVMPQDYVLEGNGRATYTVPGLKCSSKGSTYQFRDVIIRYDAIGGIQDQVLMGEVPIAGVCE